MKRVIPVTGPEMLLYCCPLYVQYCHKFAMPFSCPVDVMDKFLGRGRSVEILIEQAWVFCSDATVRTNAFVGDCPLTLFVAMLYIDIDRHYDVVEFHPEWYDASCLYRITGTIV